jgi:hypothetical protein
MRCTGKRPKRPELLCRRHDTAPGRQRAVRLLAVFFSLAYERTGQLGTAVVAHACFNLNTLLVLFAGLGP